MVGSSVKHANYDPSCNGAKLFGQIRRGFRREFKAFEIEEKHFEVLLVVLSCSHDPLSKRETITFNWTCCCSRSTEEDKNVNEDPKSYFSEDTDQFNIKNSRHWTVPINYACILVRDSKLIKDTKDVMAAIIKFQQSLGNLLQFHDNPFPPLCIIVVDVVFLGYILLGTFSLQHCYEPSDNFVLGVIYVSSKLLLCNG